MVGHLFYAVRTTHGTETVSRSHPYSYPSFAQSQSLAFFLNHCVTLIRVRSTLLRSRIAGSSRAESRRGGGTPTLSLSLSLVRGLSMVPNEFFFDNYTQ